MGVALMVAEGADGAGVGTAVEAEVGRGAVGGRLAAVPHPAQASATASTSDRALSRITVNHLRLRVPSRIMPAAA